MARANFPDARELRNTYGESKHDREFFGRGNPRDNFNKGREGRNDGYKRG